MYDKRQSTLPLMNSLDDTSDLGVGFKDDGFELDVRECCSRVVVTHS